MGTYPPHSSLNVYVCKIPSSSPQRSLSFSATLNHVAHIGAFSYKSKCTHLLNFCVKASKVTSKINQLTRLHSHIVLLPPSQNGSPTSQKNLSQNHCPVYLTGQKFQAQSQICSHKTFYIKKSFDTATSRGISEQLFFFQSHTYNYLSSQ